MRTVDACIHSLSKNDDRRNKRHFSFTFTLTIINALRKFF